MTHHPPFTEVRVARPGGQVYARDYAGAGPAFVLMHGFPDHLGIYDALVPHLVAAGRRVVTFDFLGFGRSEKRADATYDFAQQLGDLEAVVDALSLAAVVPVVHDASGPAGINYAIEHADRVAALCILNAAYDDASPDIWPELIALFAEPRLAALGRAIATDAATFGWLLGWQREQFARSLRPDQRAGFERGIGQLIADNFTVQPGSGPAFLQLASHFFDELARNTQRLPRLAALDVPVKVIWGARDPYLTTAAAQDRAGHFRNASLTLLDAGHWLQADVPAEVAKAMLS